MASFNMSVRNNTEDNKSIAFMSQEPSGIATGFNVTMMICTTILNAFVTAFFCCSKKIQPSTFNKQVRVMSFTDTLTGLSLLGPILSYVYSSGINTYICGTCIGAFFTMQMIGLSQILGICIQRLIITFSIDTVISERRKAYFILHFIASWTLLPLVVTYNFIRYQVSEKNLKLCDLAQFFGNNVGTAMYPLHMIFVGLQISTTATYTLLWVKLKMNIRRAIPKNSKPEADLPPANADSEANMTNVHNPSSPKTSQREPQLHLRTDNDRSVHSKALHDTNKLPHQMSNGNRNLRPVRVLRSTTTALLMQQRSLNTVGILLLCYNLFLSPLTVGGVVKLFISDQEANVPINAFAGIIAGNSLVNVFVYAFRTPELQKFLVEKRQSVVKSVTSSFTKT